MRLTAGRTSGEWSSYQVYLSLLLRCSLDTFYSMQVYTSQMIDTAKTESD
jgi:hypothetical protein